MKKFVIGVVVFLFAGYALHASLMLCSGTEAAPMSSQQVSGEHLGQPQEQIIPGEINWPLKDGEKREKRLTFGLYVTPEENPIKPAERFTGYHTGLDFEIFPEELEIDVAVLAVCDGKVRGVGPVDGYGGVIIQSCILKEEEVSVLYGHLDLKGSSYEIGQDVKKGDEVGILAAQKSEESGYTRKHLHLAIRRGVEIDIPGYVDNEAHLKNYLDPMPLLVPSVSHSQAFFSLKRTTVTSQTHIFICYLTRITSFLGSKVYEF